jgi:DNA-damage-inducible protein J
MANTLIQFREDEAKRKCPFSMTIEKKDENPGLTALKRASRIAEEIGIADMSLDEINAEIAETRRM